MEKREQLPKTLTFTFTVTRYLNRKSYFYSYKAGKKTNMAVIQICLKLTWNYVSTYLHNKKSLLQLGTSANIQK